MTGMSAYGDWAMENNPTLARFVRGFAVSAAMSGDETMTGMVENLLDRKIGFDVVTELQWRRPDGMVLQRCRLAPMMQVWLLVDYPGPYDVYARTDRAEWRLIYEVRTPVSGGMTVARIQD